MLVLANGTHTALKTKLRLASTRRSDDLGDASTWQSSTKSSIERNQSCGQEAHPLLFGHDAFCYGTRLWADVGGHCTQEVVANCGVQPKQADELLPILVHEILQKKATINTRVGMNTEAPGMKVQNNSVQLRGTKPQGVNTATPPPESATQSGQGKTARERQTLAHPMLARSSASAQSLESPMRLSRRFAMARTAHLS